MRRPGLIVAAGAWSGTVGPALFAAVLAALTALQYDFMIGIGWRPLADPGGAWPSGLALGPYGWAMDAAFVLSGGLLCVFAGASSPATWRRSGRRSRFGAYNPADDGTGGAGMIAGYGAGERGARAAARAGAAVIVVDAYRASTTIAVLVSKGARVVPVASIEEAARYPGADYRVGERGSAKVAGFDFGNSPTEVQAAPIPPGSTVVLSSTNGTRIIEATHAAPAVYIGAFVNARAVADGLLETATDDFRIVVVGCGWRGRRSSEDESASGTILSHLRENGATLDERAERIVADSRRRPESALRKNTAARRLERLDYGRDLDFCLAPDTVPVVPRLIDGAFVRAASQAAGVIPPNQ